jgi:vitamin B12 transporter
MSFDLVAKLIYFFTSLLLTSAIFAADDVYVITADRINSSTDKSTSDVRIFTADEIHKSTAHGLPELLSKESDLSVVSSGPFGSSSSLFLRGTDSSHTLVVIDGIIMNDPSNPNRQFDIGKLSLNNIERIEVLKGSQGLAYGSNAIGGVIVITTKKAKAKRLTAEGYFDYGTFNTINTGTNFQKKVLDNLGLSFGVDYIKTDGFSAADEKYNPNAEKDGDKQVTLNLGGTLDLPGQYYIDSIVRYSQNEADLDKGGGPENDDPNDHKKEEELYSKIQLTKNWEAGNAESKIAYNFSKHYRLTETDSRSVSAGEIKMMTANHTYYISEKLTQIANIDFMDEQDQTGHFNQNLSAFLYHQYELPSLIFNFGLRLDHNMIFDNHYTYKLAAGQKLDTGLLKIAYSTGFRAPSINQLYTPQYGNKNLVPETSQNIELSLEKKWSVFLKQVSTLFYTVIENRFSYIPVTFVNINSGKAEMKGLEQKFIVDWSSNLNQQFSATFLKAQDLKLNEKLVRRPDLNIKNIFSYLMGNKHYFNYEVAYTGSRNDVDNLGNTIKMDSYLLSNFNYRFVLNSQNEFYFKIKNLFDKDYEEAYGYGTGGRTFTIGAHYNY